MQLARSDEHPLDDLLPLQHVTFDAPATPAPHTLAASLGLSPLTLVEDSLACSADFLLLHAINKRVGSHAAKPQPIAAIAAAASVPAAGEGAKPAVLLCSFKHSAEHYTHIARKWVRHTASEQVHCRDSLRAECVIAVRN